MSVRIGIDFLKSSSRFDIGQSVVVDGKRIIAVESEGTDKMLARCNSGILIKMPKFGQSMYADLPTIGMATIKAVAKSGLRGIVISPVTIVLDQNECIKYATENNIFIASVDW